MTQLRLSPQQQTLLPGDERMAELRYYAHAITYAINSIPPYETFVNLAQLQQIVAFDKVVIKFI